MGKDLSETMLFTPLDDDKKNMREIMAVVYQALVEKGYQPENQIIGYILSGDPTYITSHNGARNLIRQIDRDELLEELLTYYLENQNIIEEKEDGE